MHADSSEISQKPSAAGLFDEIQVYGDVDPAHNRQVAPHAGEWGVPSPVFDSSSSLYGRPLGPIMPALAGAAAAWAMRGS